jgi:hypothetical protein
VIYRVISRTCQTFFFTTLCVLLQNLLIIVYNSRGYQRVGENITKGKLDMQEAIDVRLFLLSIFFAAQS